MSPSTTHGHADYVDQDVLHLSTLDHAAADARRFVAERLTTWECSDECVDVVTLLASEIVTNATRHAPPPLDLTLLHGEPGIRVEVTDSSPELVNERRPDLDSEGGRGMWLVEILADRWGHGPHGPGKQVWFELQDPPPRHTPEPENAP